MPTGQLKFKVVTVDWERDLDDVRHAWIKAIAEETLRVPTGGFAAYEGTPPDRRGMCT